MNSKRHIVNIVLGIFAFLFIMLAIWAAFFGPCELYSFAASKEVPARCLSNFTGGRG